MLRTEVIQNYGVLDRLQDFAQTYPQVLADEGERAVQIVAPHLIAELSYTPPRYHGKRIWTSIRQQKAYFATNGFGGGIPYKRTGKLSASWKVFAVVSPGGVAVRVVNPVKSAKYVVGNIYTRGRDPQQAMHVQGGWPRADKTIAFWADAMRETWVKNVRGYIKGL